MKSLYAFPLRVYLCLGILALAGVMAGWQLSVSLFPNSSKPTIAVEIPYGNQTLLEFRNQHGNVIEALLRGIATETVEAEKSKVFYSEDSVQYEIEFKWGAAPRAALKEVENIIYTYAAQLPDETRKQISIHPRHSNSGFFLTSFYSSTRSLDELYRLIEPLLMPQILKLRDVAHPELFNPMEKEIEIELDSHRMAAFQLLPKDIEKAVKSALTAFNGGLITVGSDRLAVQVPRTFQTLEDLNEILIPTPAKQFVHLTDVARVDYDLQKLHGSFWKTSGKESLILWSKPRMGGNVKRMAEEIKKAIEFVRPMLPPDVQYKILVDPSEFIQSAIRNVLFEVGLGAFLAVLVLYIFLGNFKNTATAAIEIPLSMVMAFIPMKLSGMSLNLISLGGLALSAGMNVDASVVVMENIFRQFEAHPKDLSSQEKLRILLKAVNEVKFAVIASTLASLVVFLPLTLTSGLADAILGDLAKTVVFSHGFSAVVALVLVPTVRLQLMSQGREKLKQSPFEKQIRQIESFYVQALKKFLKNQKFQNLTYCSIVGVFILFGALILPRLPKEVMGKPDANHLLVNLFTQGNTLLRQMEEVAGDVEAGLINRFGKAIQYTVSNVWQANSAWIMLHLKNKSDMVHVLKEIESDLVDTPSVKYVVEQWNPSELSLPSELLMKLTIRGGSVPDRIHAARELYETFEQKQILPRLWSDPSLSRSQTVLLKPYPQIWSNLYNRHSHLSPSDLADWVRVITMGRSIGSVSLDGWNRNIVLRAQISGIFNPEDVAAIPIGLGDKIVPLKALTAIQNTESVPALYQEDQRESFVIYGKQNLGDSPALGKHRLQEVQKIVEQWSTRSPETESVDSSRPIVVLEEPNPEMDDSIRQLGVAVALSVALILLILILQFGDLIHALLVLVAVPLGMIGVLLSLFIFKSTLSLNSILGVILLNGITVANSIILVDFLKKRVEEGALAEEAALDAARKRIRPILMTSLTTILGMFPIALGWGEGGKVLQPLGIAVAGGLWVSMGLTLFIVPALQVSYLNWKKHSQGFVSRGIRQ